MKTMYKIYLLLLLIVGVLLACQTKQASQKDSLIGTWQNTLLKVELKSYQGVAGKDSSFVITQQNWEDMLKMKPIKTNYSADSTWQSTYFDLSGKATSVTSGKWWQSGDTLWAHTQIPKDELNFYLCQVKDNKATFKTTIDWDGDGVADDLYYGEQELVE